MMNFYNLSNQLSGFVINWVSKKIGFNNVKSIKREENSFLLETNEGNYELTFKKVEE